MSDGERSRSDDYLSEKVWVRLTPGERAWVQAVARGMDPPVSEAYVIRGALIGWRQITTHPLIESLKPLPIPMDGGGPPETTLHKPPRRSRK